MTSDLSGLVGESRLPTVGTTIFTVMSALAVKTGAINLGQGFPDFDCDPALVDAVTAAMRAGHNQYPPMTGVPALRQAVSDKVAMTTGHRYDADSEITITAGATQGILSTVLALVHPGDDVIVLEPCYDSYGPSITLAGGEPDEARRIEVDLKGVLQAMRLLVIGTTNLTWVTAGYGWFTLVAPILVAAPLYFDGELSFGGLMMASGAFVQVQSSLRWFVDNFSTLADWRATLLRVASFRRALLACD